MQSSEARSLTRQQANYQANAPAGLRLEADLSAGEQEMLQEVLRALRAIRFGSVVLTLHDGNVVEIQKTERIRKGPAKQI